MQHGLLLSKMRLYFGLCVAYVASLFLIGDANGDGGSSLNSTNNSALMNTSTSSSPNSSAFLSQNNSFLMDTSAFASSNTSAYFSSTNFTFAITSFSQQLPQTSAIPTTNSLCPCTLSYFPNEDVPYRCSEVQTFSCLCPINTYKKTVNAQRRCVQCPAGTFDSNIGGALPTSGLPTFCESCAPSGTYIPPVKAASGSILSASCICNPGYTGSDCLPCPYDTYKPSNGTGDCLPCPDSSVTVATATPTLDGCYCIPGYYRIAVADLVRCLACSLGLYSTVVDADQCQACAGGTYKDYSGPGNCLPCPANASSDPGSTAAGDCSCEPGHYSPGQDQPPVPAAGCSACPPNTYKAVPGPGPCQPCSAGALSMPASTDPADCLCAPGHGFVGEGLPCPPCSEGQYRAGTANEACQTCAAGKNSDAVAADSEDVCRPCPDGAWSAGGNSSCRCNAGYSGPAEEGCAACLPGSYKEEAGPAACQSCPAGKYAIAAAAANRSDCHSCPANTGTSGAGEAGASNCTCLPGLELTEAADSVQGRLECSQCAPGRYKARLGAEACSPCHAGTYASAQGAVACRACPNRSNTVTDGMASCTCNPGYSAPESASTSLTSWMPELPDCTACPEGTHKPNQSEPLLNGTRALYECLQCAVGEYAADPAALVCLPCPGHGWSRAGAVSCTCNVGYVPEDPGNWAAAAGMNFNPQGTCIACDAGTYSAAGFLPCASCSEPGSPGNCTCANESLVVTMGSAPHVVMMEVMSAGPLECHPCWPGKYSGIGQSVCLSCANDAWSPSGSSNCTCNVGYYSVSGSGLNLSGPLSCQPCPVGTWMPADKPFICVECAANTYSPTSASTVCLLCPTYAWSPLNSSSIADCKCAPGYYGLTSGSGCAPCALGTYSDILGATACFACPPETTTKLGAANRSDACLPCRADSGDLYRPVAVGFTACPSNSNSATAALANDTSENDFLTAEQAAALSKVLSSATASIVGVTVVASTVATVLLGQTLSTGSSNMIDQVSFLYSQRTISTGPAFHSIARKLSCSFL